MVLSGRKLIILAYIFFVFVVLPLMSPLRALGIMEPGLIRNMVLPPLLVLAVVIFGVGYVLKPKTYIQVVLAVAIFLAMILGALSIEDKSDYRSYFSHLFQVSSAYIMVSIGWRMFDQLSEKLWARLVYMSLVAAIFSSALTIKALGEGEIGRFYTPAYGFILTFAYGLVVSKKITLASFFGGIVSNKRGVLLSLFIMIAAHAIAEVKKGAISKSVLLKHGFSFLLMVSVVVVGSFGLVAWADNPENRETGLGRAVNISYNRILDTIQRPEEKSLNEISAGRMEEIEAALEDLDGFDYIFGSGAGWKIESREGKEVQNIHFSPLSITAVYGLPVALMIYSMLSLLVIKGLFRRGDDITITERIAPLYLLGALVHSLVAYSLFIDWLVFFFAGVLARSLLNRRPITFGCANG